MPHAAWSIQLAHLDPMFSKPSQSLLTWKVIESFCSPLLKSTVDFLRMQLIIHNEMMKAWCRRLQKILKFSPSVSWIHWMISIFLVSFVTPVSKQSCNALIPSSLSYCIACPTKPKVPPSCWHAHCRCSIKDQKQVLPSRIICWVRGHSS
jgi:hypothetical protein